MSQEQLNKIKDLFGAEWTPEVIEDERKDFDKPIKGGYKARIEGLTRYTGESAKCEGGVYDMYSLRLQVVETIEGESAENRYITKTYSNTVGKYQEDAEEGRRRLLNDLFTGNVQYDVIREDDATAENVIEQIAPQIIDQVVSVRCYATKQGKQAVRIVKEIKTSPTAKSEQSDW